MPIEEISTGLLSAIFRLVGWLFFELIIEILVKGLGYLVCRPFKNVDIDSVTALVVGLTSWILILFLVLQVWSWTSTNIKIDECLDVGGRYNYEFDICEY